MSLQGLRNESLSDDNVADDPLFNYLTKESKANGSLRQLRF